MLYLSFFTTIARPFPEFGHRISLHSKISMFRRLISWIIFTALHGWCILEIFQIPIFFSFGAFLSDLGILSTVLPFKGCRYWNSIFSKCHILWCLGVFWLIFNVVVFQWLSPSLRSWLFLNNSIAFEANVFTEDALPLISYPTCNCWLVIGE